MEWLIRWASRPIIFLWVNEFVEYGRNVSFVLNTAWPCRPVPCRMNKWLKSPMRGIVFISRKKVNSEVGCSNDLPNFSFPTMSDWVPSDHFTILAFDCVVSLPDASVIFLHLKGNDPIFQNYSKLVFPTYLMVFSTLSLSLVRPSSSSSSSSSASSS